jgi:hypothetical protein
MMMAIACWGCSSLIQWLELARRVDPAILKGLVGARGHAIDIHHRSMNERRSEEMWRTITPHAFAHDGLRWHVRAFCHIDRIFKDFVLSRCIAVGGSNLRKPSRRTTLIGTPISTSSSNPTWC